MLDVGQGLSVLVRTDQHNLLYDAGPRFGEFDTFEKLVDAIVDRNLTGQQSFDDLRCSALVNVH